MRRRKAVLTDQELEIMKVVWAVGNVTVREVYEELRKGRKLAYTTVMTMMGILEQKGHLTRKSDGRAYVYRPSQPKARVVGKMVQDFLGRVFDGSAEPLLEHLVESNDIGEEQLEDIRKMVRDRRRKR